MASSKGSITVFLSLTAILIFALLGTLVETARYTVCKNHVLRTLQTAAEGLLTEYSRPLYEQYGLFFIESEGTPYTDVMAKYIGDTTEAAAKGNKDFLAGHLTSLDVIDKTYSGDNKAAALRQEITDYMGREVTKESLDKLLGKSSQLQNIEEQAKRMEETVEKEKEEAKMDRQLLELMRLVDGISVTNGKVSCCRDFVKCFATREKKGQNFSVTEPVVWEKMKPQVDERTRTWKITGKADFLVKISRVKQITEKAIEKGKELQAAYSSAISAQEREENGIQKILAALPCLPANLSILEKTEQLLQKASVEECREDLQLLWQDYDTTSIVFDYTGVQESGGADSPKDALKGSWGKGILNLVCANPKDLSKKSIANPDMFAQYYDCNEESADYDSRIGAFADTDTVGLSGVLGDMGEYALDEFCLDSYIQKKFGSFVNQITEWKQALDYGLEYVVAGKGSDEDNLKSVLNRILLIRTVVNTAALYQDKAKKAEAQAAAVAVVGFTGLQPLITLTKTMILITWAIVESLVDIAGLLQQKEVPLWKKTSQITTDFLQVFQINRNAIVGRASKLKKQGKHSFGYQQYLLLFLASTAQDIRLYRIMDLIQQNMRINAYKDFQLGLCVHDIKVRGTMNFPTQFFRLAVLQKMSGRNLKNYSLTQEVVVGY